MTVIYHLNFAQDIRKFEAEYREISAGLAARFRSEVDDALVAIKAAPQAAGHFLWTGARVVPECRRRNLRAFPFFVLLASLATSCWLARSSPVGPTHSRG